ncbi:hypothetical protein GCM10028781_26270 [Nostocoides australiense]
MAITGPVTLVTLTIRAEPLARRCGSAARHTRYAVSRFRAKLARHRWTRSVVDPSTTLAPSPARRVAAAYPIPVGDPAPVTMAVRPVRSRWVGSTGLSIDIRARSVGGAP